MEGANIGNLDKEINKLKQEKSEYFYDLGNESGKKFVEKFNSITGLKINKISTLVELFDPKSVYYIDKIKNSMALVNNQHKIRGKAIKEETDKLKRALGYIDAMKSTVFGAGLQEIADLTEQQRLELSGYYEGYVSYHEKYYGIQKDINEENKKAADDLADAKKKSAVELAAYENEQLQKRLKAELDAYSDELYREMSYNDRYGVPFKMEEVTANPTHTTTQVTSTLPTPSLPTPKEYSFTHNPFVNDAEIAKYDAIQQKMTNLQQAIAINTQLDGEQSLQVSIL
jgi:hypothetical protein